MQKAILSKIFCLIFCAIFSSCQEVKIIANPFLLSSLPNIQEFEKQDHVFCSSLKIDFDKNSDLMTNQNYWRCRLSLAKYRLRTDKMPDSVRHNLEISDLVTKISLKVSQSSQSILIHENNKLDERHHKQCLEMGYEIATNDQTKIDDYFACRFALVNKYEEAPYGNDAYLNYPNSSYNTSFVIDRRIEKNIELHSKQKEKYPDCIKYNIYGEDFKRCSQAQDNSKQCSDAIQQKKFLKEWEEKIRCQRGAYSNLPDAFLKGNNVESTKINNSDYSFSALGVDETQFAAKTKEKTAEEKRKEKEQKQKELRAKINSKRNLYDKYELTKLRQKYIISCQKEADVRVQEYIDSVKQSCEEMKTFQKIDE